jgi:hypothetical protein
MKVENIDCTRFRNDEHFQFATDFKNLVEEFKTNLVLKIDPQFEKFRAVYRKEDDALRKINKSVFTDDIQTRDAKRDATFKGLTETNKAALNHFVPNKVAAAKRLKIVFDTYGNVAKMGYNEETSAIYNMLQDLNGKFAADVNTVGILDWVKELEANNNEFQALLQDRYDEVAARTTVNLREARKELDAAFYTLVERINALMIVEGTAVYEPFVRKLNVIIEKYRNNLAQRLGKSKSKNQRNKSDNPPAEGDADSGNLDDDSDDDARLKEPNN